MLEQDANPSKDIEVVQARGNEETLSERLENDKKELLEKTDNLFFYPEFTREPEIFYRNDVYKHTLEIGESLTIESSDYDEAVGNRDFAFILREPIAPGDKVEIYMTCIYAGDKEEIAFRMAYGTTYKQKVKQGENKNLKIEFTHPKNAKSNTFLYIDFLGNASLKIYSIHVQTNTVNRVFSFRDVSKRVERQKYDIVNDIESVNRLIEVAATYNKNLEKFIYGNFHTAYDKEVIQVNGKYEIDCSSFVSLCLQGVTFNNSRYQKEINLTDSWGYEGINPYKFRYSGEMAKDLSDKGYTFAPKDDLSNLMPGDIIFYKWKENHKPEDEEFRRRSFMGIQHVGFFIDKKGEDGFRLLQLDNGFTTTFYNADAKFMSQAVLVARLPILNKYKDKTDLSKYPNKKYTSNNSTAAKIELNETLEKDKYYTVILEGETINPEHYFILMSDDYKVLESGISFNKGQKKWIFRFINSLGTHSRLSIGVGDRLGISNGENDRNSFINSINIFEGYIDELTVSRDTKDVIYDLGIDKKYLDNTWPGMNPYATYTIDRNKMFIEVNLPFKESYSGNVVLGTIPVKNHFPQSVKRIPVFLKEKTTQLPIFGHLFIANGILNLEPQEKNKFYEHLMINATVSL